MAYSRGDGVKKDDRKALDLFLAGAQLGDLECNYIVGVWLETGRGGERGTGSAEAFYRKAYEGGHGAAACALALLIERRVGMEQQSIKMIKQAYHWGYERAAILFEERITPSIPPVIRNAGPDWVKKFTLDILATGSIPWKQAKVMVIGRECVGKTQLYHSLRRQVIISDFSFVFGFDFEGGGLFPPIELFISISPCCCPSSVTIICPQTESKCTSFP